MRRRSFIRGLLGAVGLVAVAPAVKLLPAPMDPFYGIDRSVDATRFMVTDVNQAARTITLCDMDALLEQEYLPGPPVMLADGDEVWNFTVGMQVTAHG